MIFDGDTVIDLSVSSTGSFSLEPNLAIVDDDYGLIFQYPRLDRFLWNHLTGKASVSSISTFSILDWIVFSGTIGRVSAMRRIGYAFQYPRLDRFLWNPFSPAREGQLFVDFQYPRLDRFLWNRCSPTNTPHCPGSFSILDWIVFSGTIPSISEDGRLTDFQYPRLDRFLWNQRLQRSI